MRTKQASSAVEAVVNRMLQPEPDEPSESDLTIAAEEMLAAIQARDPEALADALRSAIALCDLGGYEPEPEPEE